MKIKSLYIPLVLLIAISCKKEGAVTISGKVSFPQQGQITITEIRQDEQKPFEETIELKPDSTFEKQILVREPGFYRVNFFNMQFINVVLDKSDIRIKADGNNPGGYYEITGSPDADIEKSLQNIMMEFQKSSRARELEAEFQEAGSQEDEAKIMELQGRYKAEILDSAFNRIAQTIRKAPPSLGLINILQNRQVLDRDKYFSVFEEVAARSIKQWPANSYTKGFDEYVTKMKKTAIGAEAPEIALPDPDGKIVKLSSFRGKYVLVDFWAKWCGPCRGENPNVVKAYHAFKDKGFDILGVSLDRARADWVQAIAEDGLVWNQVSDLRYFESQAAKDYNINGIPFSILIDPNGIIIAKNLRGPDLHKKLDEVLNKKS